MDEQPEQSESDLSLGVENTDLNNDEPVQETQANETSEKGQSPSLNANAENALDQKTGEVDEATSTEALAETGVAGGDTPEPGEDAGDEAPTVTDQPASVAFDEGDGPEATDLNGEPLSRDGSVILEVEQDDNSDHSPVLLELGTPKSGSCSPEPQSEKIEERPPPAEEAGPRINYKEQVNLLHELQMENEKLSQLDSQLQMKLVEYIRKKTGDDTQKEKAALDQEQRYQKYMAMMADLKLQHQRDSEAGRLQAEDLRLQVQEKLIQVESEWQSVMVLKRDVAVAALSRRLGKQAAQAEVEQIQAAEQRRENELVRVRLENIKLKNKTKKYEATLRAKEELAEGLHLIDFEQLKIENQTYNEKIEERNEELLKLRKKITNTVQVLTHVKEKLQFVQTENLAKRAQQADVEAVLACRRDVLTRTKQARDGLRTDNLRLRQRSGLLGNETLLRDFEEKVDASDGLEERLERLKRRHAELILKCAGVKKKLEQTKPQSQ
ncbi:coiled-coil domain-containing protein 96 [Osmerus mordax]|uniref:coiled-coil domain-containing protein 96 n=1 Tax=Osmerus mordax TaxID=8014 RepID=UPI00350F542D